jgi:hypothetical protein
MAIFNHFSTSFHRRISFFILKLLLLLLSSFSNTTFSTRSINISTHITSTLSTNSHLLIANTLLSRCISLSHIATHLLFGSLINISKSIHSLHISAHIILILQIHILWINNATSGSSIWSSTRLSTSIHITLSILCLLITLILYISTLSIHLLVLLLLLRYTKFRYNLLEFIHFFLLFL